jgi:Cu2+-exporting ATPase
VLAAGAAAAWSVIDPSRAVWVAVSVLIVTCPCALSLAAPSALLSATSALARRGVLLQRLDALETLTRLDRIYFDKTGTVTDEHLQFTGAQRLDGPADAAQDAQGLALAASLAGWSQHPLSQALVAAAGRADGATSGSTGTAASPWHAVQELPGQGLQALDAQGRCWRLGRADFVAPGRAPAMDGMADGDGRAAVWWGADGHASLRFDFDEALRPDAMAAVSALRQRGLQVVLLSGDRPARAQRMGARLVVDAVIGGATPESKLSEVAAAQAQGLKVGMVGDGINDAPVLARADVSFAMGQGALVSRAQADAVVASSRLGDLVLAHDLARRCMAVVRQNMLWAATYNAVCIPLALVGWLPPWAAGLGMATSSLLVIGNSMRLARPLRASADAGLTQG